MRQLGGARAQYARNMLISIPSFCGLRSSRMRDWERMSGRPGNRRKAGFFEHHALSLTVIGIALLWVILYRHSNPETHTGSFFGNAIADWTGVVFIVIATKYFYEIGSAESKQPGSRSGNPVIEMLRRHSLSIFLALTGVGWLLLYLKMDSEGKWGEVVGNIVTEWTQLLGLVLLTRRLVEEKSKEKQAIVTSRYQALSPA